MILTRNRRYGFWGTTHLYLKDKGKTQEIWRITSDEVARWIGYSPAHNVYDLARAYLDGKPGRHLADFCNSKGWRVTLDDLIGYLNRNVKALAEIARELA